MLQLRLQGGINTYTYVRNNPLNRIDPKGLFDILSPGDWVTAGIFATVAALIPDAAQQLSNSSANSNDNNSAPCPPEACYGPYYRYETNPAYVNQAISTGWLYGTTPQGGLSPTVQAYRLPKDASNELKFCTGVKPASGGGPIQSWYQGMPGVINHDDVTVKIPIVPIQ